MITRQRGRELITERRIAAEGPMSDFVEQMRATPLPRAFYYLSRITIERGADPGMATWRKRLFIGLSHNAASPATDFRLPADRTVVMGSRINL